ncbi:CinA family protein [Agarilytica rhodophyticola]|uniref:CinA family protein n=1 Tax=Agarilytica rhodophyticola TaxID=1737490 RepID=UPI000B346247|nr:CinA family protein [Agarilytica rhodophyticola]
MNQEIVKLAQQLGQVLGSNNYQVTTAESCTGGGVSTAITEIAGSSAWFSAGFVTYSNEIKEKVLNVPSNILDSYGAVSHQVVEAMLRGAISISAADVGVAISGIAGPTGAAPGKPVGTICFAVGSTSKVNTYTEYFEGNRSEIREQAVVTALSYLLDFCSLEQAV